MGPIRSWREQPRHLLTTKYPPRRLSPPASRRLAPMCHRHLAPMCHRHLAPMCRQANQQRSPTAGPVAAPVAPPAPGLFWTLNVTCHGSTPLVSQTTIWRPVAPVTTNAAPEYLANSTRLVPSLELHGDSTAMKLPSATSCSAAASTALLTCRLTSWATAFLPALAASCAAFVRRSITEAWAAARQCGAARLTVAANTVIVQWRTSMPIS